MKKLNPKYTNTSSNQNNLQYPRISMIFFCYREIGNRGSLYRNLGIPRKRIYLEERKNRLR